MIKAIIYVVVLMLYDEHDWPEMLDGLAAE